MPKGPQLTDELIQRICDLVRAGVDEKDVPVALNIPDVTFGEWQARGYRSRTGQNRRLVDGLVAAAEARIREVMGKLDALGSHEVAAVRILLDRLEERRRRHIMQCRPLPGRATKLDIDMIYRIANSIRRGTPKSVACRAACIAPDTLRTWCERGQADVARGRVDSVYARLVTTLNYSSAQGHEDYWESVHRGRETGQKEHVAAGRLALDAIDFRWGRKYAPPPADAAGAEGNGQLTVKVVLEGPAQEVTPATQPPSAPGAAPQQEPH